MKKKEKNNKKYDHIDHTHLTILIFLNSDKISYTSTFKQASNLGVFYIELIDTKAFRTVINFHNYIQYY